jgi:ElaB/YqjD/DUF883 family membrane-anchored ribosome-binding protein
MEYRADKDELAKAMEKTATRMEDTGARTAGKVAGTMRGMADEIRSFNINEYRDRAMRVVDDAKATVDRDVDNVKTGISEHPIESVAIAMGAGILMGAALAIMGRHAAAKRMSRM